MPRRVPGTCRARARRGAPPRSASGRPHRGADSDVGGAMELEQDSHPGGERTTGASLDPAVPPTAVAGSLHGPMPEGAAPRPVGALTETLVQPHKPIVAT